MASDVCSFMVCDLCHGEPRSGVTCSACGGAGVGIPSADGYLVWGVPFDAFFFRFRHLRLKINSAFHLVLAGLIVMGIGLFFYGAATQENIGEIVQFSFWLEHRGWYFMSLWAGLFLLCFFIFRLRVYGFEAKTLSHWANPRFSFAEEQKRLAETDPKRGLDISPYFSASAWSVLERAYLLASRTGRMEVASSHLFASALSSPAGGIFMTRLGMDFEKVKDALVALMRIGQSGHPTLLSLEGRKILLSAYLSAREAKRKFIGPMELFLQAFLANEPLQNALDAAGYPPKHVRKVMEWIRLQEGLQEEHDRFVLLAALKPKGRMNRSMTARQTEFLNRLGEDLTLAARNGYVAPMVGRLKEMDGLLRAIESGRRSVALVGEPGSGKMALVEALARRMVEEDVPPELFDRRLVVLDVPQLLSMGEPERAVGRLLAVLDEVALSGNIILVVPLLETLVGGSMGSLDVAEAFAAELDKGYFIAIGLTTPQAWTEMIERRTLGSKLVRVDVPDLEPEEALEVLMAKSGFLEYENRVFFTYAALEKAVELSGRYLHESHLPESAIDVAKEAAVLARKERGEHGLVGVEDVARVIHDKTHIPVESVTQDESQKLLNLEARLHVRVIGQDEAVSAVSAALRRARAGVREGRRPIANFLFLGPTGVGKTELAKALAAEYFGSEDAMIRLDMSEYQDHTSVSRVIGAPGDDRGGLLTEAIRHQPFSLVLLDELEKAHPDILTLFLQVMDDGRLTDGIGRTIDCTNIVLIATSNAGTVFIQEQVKIGTAMERIKTALLERELKGIFRPEFLNRFDGVIVFKPLTLDDVTQIAWLMMNQIGKRLEQQGILFRAEDAAVEELAKQGFDPLFGARPLRRTIQEKVDNALADLLLRKAVRRRDTIVLEPGAQIRVEQTSSGV